MKRVFLSILVLLSFSLSGQDLSFNSLENFQIEKLQGKELILNFDIRIENPLNKNFGVTVKKGMLYKDGEYYGSYKLLKKIKIKKKSNEKVNVRIKVMLEKDVNLAQEGLKALISKNIIFRLKGQFKATWLIFWKNFPFDQEEKISLKELLGN